MKKIHYIPFLSMTSKIHCGILYISVCMWLFRNVSPGGEQSLAESTHSFKLLLHFTNVPCHPSAEVLDTDQVLWTMRTCSKKYYLNIICLKKSFDLRAVWIAAISCWKIKFSSNKRVLLMKSDDRFKMPMYPIASWRPCPTFHSSPTWECAPYHDSASFAPSRWESLRRDILFMPMALNTIKVNIFLRIIKISSTSQHHVYDDFWKIPISQ